MPQLFKVGNYLVYFWSNENRPLEPIHVLISDGDPKPNATKIWITKDKRAMICNNSSNIPKHELRFLLRIIEATRICEIASKYLPNYDVNKIMDELKKRYAS